MSVFLFQMANAIWKAIMEVQPEMAAHRIFNVLKASTAQTMQRM